MELLSEFRSFAGRQQRYRHTSKILNCEMTFSIFLPEKAKTEQVPLVYWLSGLTCTDENFVQKAGAQRMAAELGIAIVAPDTSPRGDGVPDDPEAAWDFGLGAGFYVDALQSPWKKHYQMYSYVVDELPKLLEASFPVDRNRQSIFGHSMGGHGALSIALRNPGRFKSVSAFAPICAPMQCPWGQKAFRHYLGEDRETWRQSDSSELLSSENALPILIDQGSADNFYTQGQLLPEKFLEKAKEVGVPVEYFLREGYDHSYFYIASFMEQHLRFHGKHLTLRN